MLVNHVCCFVLSTHARGLSGRVGLKLKNAASMRASSSPSHTMCWQGVAKSRSGADAMAVLGQGKGRVNGIGADRKEDQIARVLV